MSQTIINQTHTLLQTTADHYTQDQYHLLVDVINYHTDLYHKYQNPIISDYEYDQLFELCKTIESKHQSILGEIDPHRLRLDSPTQRVGSDIQDGFEQASHLTPLLSLENSYNAENLQDRDESISKLLNKI